jgi:ABC-type polysaccharide transport system permease subunit
MRKYNSFDAQKNHIFVILVKFVVKFMFFLYVPVLPVSIIILNYSSGKFSILTKTWISIKLHLIDPKFHGDHEYWGYLVGSLMVKALSLTSGKFA